MALNKTKSLYIGKERHFFWDKQINSIFICLALQISQEQNPTNYYEKIAF